MCNQWACGSVAALWHSSREYDGHEKGREVWEKEITVARAARAITPTIASIVTAIAARKERGPGDGDIVYPCCGGEEERDGKTTDENPSRSKVKKIPSTLILCYRDIAQTYSHAFVLLPVL